MLTSLALIFLCGIALGWIFEKLRLPRLVGMLLTGMLLGPYAFGLLDGSILSISADLRQLALIIILIKAGLSLNLSDLKKVGRPAILLSFLPAICEILAVVLLAPPLLGVSRLDAAIMGVVLGAVSPAVVVPKMVQLMEQRRGTAKGIPQMILAGASLDDVFVIVLFTAFTGLAQGEQVSAWSFASVPVSIVTGLVGGALVGCGIAVLFRRVHLRDSVKILILLGVSFLLVAAEGWLDGAVPFSGLLAVMAAAVAVQRLHGVAAGRLSVRFSKLWVAAEIVLFVLVGAAVNLRSAADAGFGVIALILLALVLRSAGVWLCLLRTRLNRKERLFCVIAYLPKATVQAAIGSVPLAMGLPCGAIVLTVAVVSILITAPLGAIGMDLTSDRLLDAE